MGVDDLREARVGDLVEPDLRRGGSSGWEMLRDI
jgi:hypothetical protein